MFARLQVTLADGNDVLGPGVVAGGARFIWEIAPRHEPERHQQCPQEHRIGQPVWNGFESLPVAIQLTERKPQRPLRSSAVQLRGDGLEQPVLSEEAKRVFCRTRSQHLVVLLDQPCRRRVRDQVTVFTNAVLDRRVEGKAKACGKSHGSEHANRIFLKALRGIANRPHDALPEILEPADVVDNRERRDVVEEGIDGEVAAKRILFRCAKRVVVPHLQFRCRFIGSSFSGCRLVLRARQDMTTKRRDLDGLVAEPNVRKTKAAADDPAVSEQLLDLVRVGIGAHVEVLGPASQEEIPDTAPDEVGDVVELLQPVENFQCIGVDISARDRVVGALDDDRLWHPARNCTACYHRHMLRRHSEVARIIVIAAWLLALNVSSAAQTAMTDLARARAHYNQRQFDDAISAAVAARQATETADVAGIVLARAHLERYRERADPTDLSAAREVLGMIHASNLDARDQVELLLALGQSLFLEDDFGAAAEMFESGLERAANTERALAEAMLEWWGSATERQAGSLSRGYRLAVFSRLADRMRQELARYPTSAAAAYWTVAALRGASEPDRAWDAAVAAWVRARLLGQRSSSLRADLDRLVVNGIIPDRVRHLPKDAQPAAESQFKADWELVKEKWK